MLIPWVSAMLLALTLGSQALIVAGEDLDAKALAGARFGFVGSSCALLGDAMGSYQPELLAQGLSLYESGGCACPGATSTAGVQLGRRIGSGCWGRAVGF